MPIDPHSESLSFQQNVKAIAESEWEHFNRGDIKECDDGGWQRIGEYWRDGVNIPDRDGCDTEYKWSAAFVSWVMKKAGAGDAFKYNSRHSVYIRDAIQKRDDSNAGFRAYRLNEATPQIGDLVCFSSGDDVGEIDYNTTRNYDSHCDIVVATKPDEIEVIGGNVQASVFKKTLPIDEQGYLLNFKPIPYWFVVIKNQFQGSSESQIRMTTISIAVKNTNSIKAEHCFVSAELLTLLGLTEGCQIRVKRNVDEYALYTVKKTSEDIDRNIVLMGKEARSRLGTTGEFTGEIDLQVVQPSFNDTTAKNNGEFVERLTDDGTHAELIVIAPHGGFIEDKTDEQAERVMRQLSSKNVSCWRCKGWRPGGGAFERWHITSTDIHESSFPRLNTVINRNFTHAVAFHGFDGNKILIGGCANDALKQEIQQAIQPVVAESDIEVEIAGANHPMNGNDPKNIVNRLSQGNGIQIEQPKAAREHYWREIAKAVALVYNSKLS